MKLIQLSYLQLVKAILCLIVVLCFNNLKASHLMGSDITYKCLGNNRYEVTLKIYRDCKGAVLQTTQSILTRCVNANWTKSFPLTRVGIKDITGLGQSCPGIKSRCAGGNYQYGIEEHVYNGIVDLTITSSPSIVCTEFTLSWSLSARNLSITTGASNQNFYTEATIFTDLAECNSSPVFSTPASSLVCYNNDFTFNNGALDTIDNDVLSYALVVPLKSRNTPIPYNGQFSANRPLTFLGFPNPNLPLPSGFHLDSSTGNLNFRPTKVNEVTVMVLEVTEHRRVNGIMRVVGKTRRDIQINVIDCQNNKPPTIEAKSMVICAGVETCIKIKTFDPNPNDTVKLMWNQGIPGATFTNAPSGTQFDSASLCWTPKQDEVRDEPYSFTVTATDNLCPLVGKSIQAVSIWVDNNPKTFFTVNDTHQCFDKHYFTFTNFADSSLFSCQWDLGNGQTRSEYHLDSFRYADTGTYIAKLIVNSPRGCYDLMEKKLRVEAIPSPFFNGLSSRYCTNDSATLLVPNVPGGLFTGKNIEGATYRPKQSGPDSVYHYINIAGCVADTTLYTQVYTSPSASFSVNKPIQCFNGHQFTFTNASVLQDGQYLSTWDFGDGLKSDSVSIANKKYAQHGNYTVTLVAASAHNCTDTAWANVEVNPEPDPWFTPLNDRYCTGPEEFLLIPRQTGGVFSGNNVYGNVFIPLEEGNDTITYTLEVKGCKASLSRATSIRTSKLIGLGEDKTICNQAPFKIDLTAPNATYLWQDGSTSPKYTISKPGIYKVLVYNECDTLQDEITVRDCFYTLLPNGFTPNGDGLNDVFMPYLENALSVYFVIYNRWGEKVFETHTPGEGWDGTLNGSKVPDGAYMWHIEVDYNDTPKAGAYKTFINNGTVTLLR